MPMRRIRDEVTNEIALLLHCEGSNGNAFFTDDSLESNGITRGGNAAHSTAQFKFGSSSVLFDGNGDFLATKALGLKNTDFTLEAWVRFASVATDQILLSTYNQAGYQANTVTLSLMSGKLNGSNGLAGGNVSGSTNLIANNWYYVALTYTYLTSTIRIYLNGILEGSIVGSVGTEAPFFWMGGSLNDNNIGSRWFNGHMDEIRVSRKVQGISTPSAPFPNP